MPHRFDGARRQQRRAVREQIAGHQPKRAAHQSDQGLSDRPEEHNGQCSTVVQLSLLKMSTRHPSFAGADLLVPARGEHLAQHTHVEFPATGLIGSPAPVTDLVCVANYWRS
jgi:hypothetical protein